MEKDNIETENIEENIDNSEVEESAAARRVRIMGERAIRKDPDTPYKQAEEKRKKQEKLTGIEERKTQRDDVVNEYYTESESAKVVNVLSTGEERDDSVVKGGWLSNFWYHHKWKVVIILFFAVVITICSVQFFSNKNPDVYIMYIGPDYINATSNTAISDSIETYIGDYNSDGEIKAQFTDLLYLNDAQVEEKRKIANSLGEPLVFDAYTNSSNYEQFTYEMMNGRSVVYFLDPAIYDTIKGDNVFLRLDEVLDVLPENTYDDYSIKLGDTDLYKNNVSVRIMSEDTIVCIRRVMGMAYFTGKDKAETALVNHTKAFNLIINGAEK